MALSRRTFLKGFAATVAGALILPPTLDENAEAAKRFWALDSTMFQQTHDIPQSYNPFATVYLDGHFGVDRGDILRITDYYAGSNVLNYATTEYCLVESVRMDEWPKVSVLVSRR